MNLGMRNAPDFGHKGSRIMRAATSLDTVPALRLPPPSGSQMNPDGLGRGDCVERSWAGNNCGDYNYHRLGNHGWSDWLSMSGSHPRLLWLHRKRAVRPADAILILAFPVTRVIRHANITSGARITAIATIASPRRFPNGYRSPAFGPGSERRSLFFTEETMPDSLRREHALPARIGRCCTPSRGASPSWTCRRMRIGSFRRRTT